MTHNSKSIDQKRESFEVIDHANIKFSVTRFSDSKLRRFLGRKKTQTNGSQLKNPDISGAPTHWEFSIPILKLNVKMAPEMSGFFNWLPLLSAENLRENFKLTCNFLINMINFLITIILSFFWVHVQSNVFLLSIISSNSSFLLWRF